MLKKCYRAFKFYSAEERNKQLEEELTESQDLARRYHDLCMSEKEKSGGTSERSVTSSRSGGSQSAGKLSERGRPASKSQNRDSGGNRPKSTGTKSNGSKNGTSQRKGQSKVKDLEDDLDDDEAKFKRHVARLIDSKSVRTTAPVRVEDIIRKNQVCANVCQIFSDPL